MSNRNGDKSRHNRLRKQKIRRRTAFRAYANGAGTATEGGAAKRAKPAKPATK